MVPPPGARALPLDAHEGGVEAAVIQLFLLPVRFVLVVERTHAHTVDLAAARAGGGGTDPFLYFVQAGAFRTPEDAEAQRAKLSLMGIEAKVTEREQSGRQVYRVRVGPFTSKDDADRQKDKLDAGGFDTALVRVQR